MTPGSMERLRVCNLIDATLLQSVMCGFRNLEFIICSNSKTLVDWKVLYNRTWISVAYIDILIRFPLHQEPHPPPACILTFAHYINPMTPAIG